MTEPEVSVIVRVRNEWPLVASTIHAYADDLESSGIPYEIIVATNQCEDFTADILLDKYRRWTRSRLLKVVEFDDYASHWAAANAGYRASTGKFVAISDGHITVKHGTMKRLLDGARKHGGIWHPAMQQWNDTSKIISYQYDIRLYDRFWGFRCIHKPPGVENDPYRIAMSHHALLLMQRTEVEEFGLYTPRFGTYGGGEPYLDMKWWMLGKTVWCDPGAIVRHAFGWRANWHEAKKDETKKKSEVYTKDGRLTKTIKKGEEYLAYNKGYKRSNYELDKNFVLAAYVLGGVRWLDHILCRFRVKGDTRLRMRREVLAEGREDHVFVREKATRTLDDLLLNPPWRTCEVQGHGDVGTVPES